MRPRDKAKELVDKFHEHSYNPSLIYNTKEWGSHDVDCALMCVEEIIKVVDLNRVNYWREVKKCIHGIRRIATEGRKRDVDSG